MIIRESAESWLRRRLYLPCPNMAFEIEIWDADKIGKINSNVCLFVCDSLSVKLGEIINPERFSFFISFAPGVQKPNKNPSRK